MSKNTFSGVFAAQLQAMANYAAEYYVPIISAAGGKMLRQLVRQKKPRSVLEIGTAIGFSTVQIASQMPSDGKITTIELQAERREMAARNFVVAGIDGRIMQLGGDAGILLGELKQTFDFVFIDGPKGQYLRYLQILLFRRLLEPGCIIAADNVLFRGLVQQELAADMPRRQRLLVRRLQAYLQFVTTNPLFSTKLCPQGDGMAISYYQGAKEE